MPSSPRALALLLPVVVLLSLPLAGCGGGSSGDPHADAPGSTRFSLTDPRYLQALRNSRTATTTSAAAPATTTAAPPTATTPAPSAGSGVLATRPPIVDDFIPFPAKRQAEMAAYAQRHYGIDTDRLKDPKVIVEHYTETPDVPSTKAIFAPDVPDSELHELPNVCAHFVVDTDGTIHQLVSMSIMCRHTVGLNWTSIGIEQVGSSDGEILGRPKQIDAVLRLTAWLQCRFHIARRNVIGHNESLTSPYHRENVAAVRGQTHDDWNRADMQGVRKRLRRYACPAG
jgi:beta-N-acetylhexosaminidase